MDHIRRSSTYEKLTEANAAEPMHPYDKMIMECEHINPTSEISSLNTSAVGPGLDSDFGASAGTTVSYTQTASCISARSRCKDVKFAIYNKTRQPKSSIKGTMSFGHFLFETKLHFVICTNAEVWALSSRCLPAHFVSR